MMDGASYSASKWGLIGLMKSAALELGEYGITVNVVIPGLVDTALTRHESRYAQTLMAAGEEPSGEVGKDEQAAKEQKVNETPLGVPWIEPDDVAPVVIFLASDDARMVTGATYDVTAGASANYSAEAGSAVTAARAHERAALIVTRNAAGGASGCHVATAAAPAVRRTLWMVGTARQPERAATANGR